MQLQDHARARRNVFVAFVDHCQHFPVARDLLFGTVARLGLLSDQLCQTLIAGVDSLDSVRRSRTLHQRHFQQRFQFVCVGLHKQFLAALMLMDAADHLDDLRRQKLRLVAVLAALFIIKHSAASPTSCIIRRFGSSRVSQNSATMATPYPP